MNYELGYKVSITDEGTVIIYDEDNTEGARAAAEKFIRGWPFIKDWADVRNPPSVIITSVKETDIPHPDPKKREKK